MEQCGGSSAAAVACIMKWLLIKLMTSENHTNKNKNKNNNIYVPKTTRARGQKSTHTESL